MSEQTPNSVRYFERQYLKTADFRQEQRFHRYHHEAHNRHQHAHGVVSGLAMRWDDEARRFVVEPGRAVAPDGRDIHLTEARALETERFDVAGLDELLVYLIYVPPEPEVRAMGSRCGRPNDGQSARESDRAELRTKARFTDATDPDPRQRVLLGRIVRDFANPDEPYRVLLAEREEVGLVAARLSAPSGLAWLDLGPSNETPSERRFSVTVRKDRKPPDETEEETKLREKVALEIDEEGRIQLGADAECHGDLRLHEGALEFRDLTADPAYASTGVPWSIYRHLDKTGALPVHELRIELPASEVNSVARVVVGSFSPDEEAFAPIVAIDHAGVRINGSLYVEKGIIDARDEAVLSDAARQMLTGSIVGGPDIAQELVTAFNSTRFVDADSAVNTMLASAGGLNSLLSKLKSQAGAFDEFLRLFVANNGDIAAILAQAKAVDPSSLGEYARQLLLEDAGVVAAQIAPATVGTGDLPGFLAALGQIAGAQGALVAEVVGLTLTLAERTLLADKLVAADSQLLVDKLAVVLPGAGLNLDAFAAAMTASTTGKTAIESIAATIAPLVVKTSAHRDAVFSALEGLDTATPVVTATDIATEMEAVISGTTWRTDFQTAVAGWTP